MTSKTGVFGRSDFGRQDSNPELYCDLKNSAMVLPIVGQLSPFASMPLPHPS